MPSHVIGFGRCEVAGMPQGAVTVYLQQRTPTGVGIVFDSTVRTTTSDPTGYYEFTGLSPGAGYLLSAGTPPGNPIVVNIPTGATDPYELPSVLSGS